MNTGIGDAVNLAWKLAAVIQGRAPDELLDSYAAERAPFARRLVQTTDRAFSFVTKSGRLARFVRSRLVPRVLPLAVHIPGARSLMFRTVSQTMLNYRKGPLAHGKAGSIRGGDRLPWVSIDGSDNFDDGSLRWQVHVYGGASANLNRWCQDHGLHLSQFRWHPRHALAGLAKDAAYLIRPDAYVAVAAPKGDHVTLGLYLNEIGMKLPGKGVWAS